MLIGGGHCCPLCSAASDWASVAPVKGQGTDLKSVTLTPHTLQRPPPPPPPHTYARRLSHLCPTPTHLNRPLPFFTFSGYCRRKWNLFASLVSFHVASSGGWLSPPHRGWWWWGGSITCGQSDRCSSAQDSLLEEDKLVLLVCFFLNYRLKKILSSKVSEVKMIFKRMRLSFLSLSG